jgi:hypothetical protein
VLLRGAVHEVLQHLGLAARGLDLVARLERHPRLELVVDLVVERALRDHALLHAGHVRGRDVDEVRRVVARRRAVEVPRAEQVRLEPLVDRRVEAHRGGRVDHDVDPLGNVWLAAREVAVDHVDALVEQRQERVIASEPLAERIERRLAGQVVHALNGRRRRLRPNEDGHAGLGKVRQETFQHNLSEEPGDPGQQDALARERVDDRASFLYHAADYAVSTVR